ncbi:MAG TPA: squalene/phytoene synthase family protein [Caulobacteraceae bacterium]|nr:squalene/phytoene synthase family protein [Caulobacteraceae bacterium]
MPLGAEDELDQLIRRVDPDRWLTSRFIADNRARTDVLALYAYDYELAHALKAASTPLLVEIRLTWWREALDEIFGERAVRRHPVAEALADAVGRWGLQREPLEAMIDGQIATLEVAQFDEASAVAWADAVEAAVAALAATVLDPAAPGQAAAPAGRAWGLALLRRSGRVSDEVLRPPLRRSLAEARAAASHLSVAAMPAALPARLARFDLAGRSPSGFTKRLALVLAAASGRL